MRIPTGVLMGVIVVGVGASAYCLYRAWQASAIGGAHPIALGTLADWLAGVGTIAAAAIALFIATADRRERRSERRSADEALAELVVVTVVVERSQYLAVKVVNYGTRAVLAVTFDSATFETDPQAKADLQYKSATFDVVDCDRKEHTFWLDFVDEAGRSVLPGNYNRSESRWDPKLRPDVAEVSASIRFRDADGVEWARNNRGSVERLSG